MTDENDNNQGSVSESGDVLGQVSKSKSKSNAAASNNKVLRSISKSTHNIDMRTSTLHKDALKILSSMKGMNASNFSDAVDSAAHGGKGKKSSKTGKSSHSFNSSTSSHDPDEDIDPKKIDPKKYVSDKAKGAFKDAIDGFEEELCDYLGIPYIGDDVGGAIKNQLNGWAKNLSDALNVPVEDLSKTVAKDVTKAYLDKNPKLATMSKKITDWYKGGLDSARDQAKKAWDGAISGMETEEFQESFKWDNIFNTSGNNQKKASSDRTPKEQAEEDLSAEKQEAENKSSGKRKNGKRQNGKRERDDSSGSVSDIASDLRDKAIDDVKDAAVDAAKDGAAKALKTGDVSALISGLKGATGAIKVAAPQLIVATTVLTALDAITDEFGVFVKRFSAGFERAKKTYNRWDESRQKQLKLQDERIQADIRTYIETPFKILEEAANKIYSVWDSALQTINGTQGYDKAGLQDLMTAYASRLRAEGLSDVVGTTDVTTMLESILNQGLSGKVAEEFAYQATVLRKAIPTEDFTPYAQAYASLASSYMALGNSQQDALKYANSQLQLFASNILTASREVSGGFTSSLTGVSGLFNDIVKIAQTGKSTDTSGISSALSIVQAVAGQVSSDVGTSLVNKIVDAAVGGNDSNLVALRSLAGTGASNTAFLQALVRNPNYVLANLFSGLESMFDKSTDNYMEVAYSLSDTFDISADALARIDWAKLVSELRNNTSSNANLEKNMKLLSSGETTTSAEAQRLAQINQYMIDQGLSYVLDNEAARQIQQHMWDMEREARMQETTYAVDFAGGARESMSSIGSLLGNIIKILTAGLSVPATYLTNSDDYLALKEDLKNLIQAGKVGNGNETAYKKLTTYKYKDLAKLGEEPNLLQMWGKDSHYFGTKGTDNIALSLSQAVSSSAPDSKYSWGKTGKSVLQAISNYKAAPYDLPGIQAYGQSPEMESQSATKMSDWVDAMKSYISEGKTYQDWYNSASDYGFSDIDSTLSDLGYSQQDLQNMYLDASTDYAVQQEVARRAQESQFYSDAIGWIENTYPADYENWNLKYDTNVASWFTTFTEQMSSWQTLYTDTMTALTEHLDMNFKSWTELYTEYTDETHKFQKSQINQFDESFINDFLYEWKDYYIGNHTHYRESTSFDSAIHTINSEKSQTGEAVLALAQSLTKDYKDLADPAVQTNVLLGQVVILLQSILTAQTSGSGLTLPTALSALGLNIGNKGD